MFPAVIVGHVVAEHNTVLVGTASGDVGMCDLASLLQVPSMTQVVHGDGDGGMENSDDASILQIDAFHPSDEPEGTDMTNLLQLERYEGGGCTRWCVQDDGGWPSKCSKKRCNTCAECQQSPVPEESTHCAQSCATWDMPWDKVCGWYECTACAECATTSTPIAIVAPPSVSPIEPFAVSFPDADAMQQEGIRADSSGPTVQLSTPSGQHFAAPVVVAGLAGPHVFELHGAIPAGLSISQRGGILTWQPDASQAGSHSIAIIVSVNGTIARNLDVELVVSVAGSLPSGIYVWPTGGSDGSEGTAGEPYGTVAHAVAAAQPGDTVYIRGGSYLAKETIVANATAANPVLVTRLPGERVCLRGEGRGTTVFYVPPESTGVTFRGLELDGDAHNNHWTVLSESWWRVNYTIRGAWNGFRVEGTHIVIENCIIHDFLQKGVNIRHGRYVTVRYNIIYNIAHASLSGGAGIHRQWMIDLPDGDDADDPRYFRYDLYGNLLFNVEQRIYSFIPWKGYCHMILDEGKTIEFDPCRDTRMRARVAHNLLLYGGVTHLRLKPTANLQIQNNAVFAEPRKTNPTADGTTAKGESPTGDRCVNHACNYGGPLINLTFFNNLAHTENGSWAYNLVGQFNDGDYPARVGHNYYSGGGGSKGVPQSREVSSVFQAPLANNFRAESSLPYTDSLGVDPSVLEHLFAMAWEYNVTVAPAGWTHDHCRNVQTIICSAPQAHVNEPTIGAASRPPSKVGERAFIFQVTSEHYQKFCQCTTIEVIPPHGYFETCEVGTVSALCRPGLTPSSESKVL